MEVVLLGTGSADGWPNPFCTCASCAAARASGVVRGQTAALVDDVLLLDCGPEAPRAAARVGRSLDRVTDMLLTHSHPDHTGPAALLWRAWADRSEPITVHGPAEALDACRDWVGPSDPVVFHPVLAGEVFETRAHTVRALAAAHGDVGSGPGLLWDLTDREGRRLLHATDTGWPSAATLEALTKAEPYDLLLLEETFGDRPDLGDDHLHLATFAALLARLREAGTVNTSTDVVAIHLGHHNPPPTELDHRLTAFGARAGRDGEVLVLGEAPPAKLAPRPRRTLVLGGARSGKSLHAEGLVAADPFVTYVATSGTRPDDAEWAQRVTRHRARRPASWTTLETTDLVAVLVAAEPHQCLLVDCLTLWLTDRMDRAGSWDTDPDDVEGTAHSHKQLATDVADLLDALRSTKAHVVLVSNEVGQGVVPTTRSGRDFRDELGRLNTAVGSVVDQVTFLVAGQALSLKGPDR